MKTAPQNDRLQALFSMLHHFDHSPDFGDSETVAAIRGHLLVRIREAQSSMRSGNSEAVRALTSNAWIRRQAAEAA